MKFGIVLTMILTLLGCGQSTEFEVNQIKTSFIQNTDKKKSTPDFYTENDTLILKSQKGITINFDVSFIESGGSQEPGNKGTKDSILDFSIFLFSKNQMKNITKYFHNDSENKATTFKYNEDFKDINEFVTSFNNLQIEKRKSLNYSNLKKLETGFDLKCNTFVFWLPESISDILTKQDTIKTVIILTNYKTLTDKMILK